MKAAALVARVGCAAARLLVALQPASFRRNFGRTVIDDIAADIAAAVPAGTRATLSVVWRSLGDAARGVLVERTTQVTATRRAMQSAFMSDLRQALRTLSRDRGFTTVALGTLTVGLALCVTVAVLVNAYLVRGLP